ncbi:MAG: VTT domain-containing protein [bacterium]|nr:VTT domain-containing protein [bacterium]
MLEYIASLVTSEPNLISASALSFAAFIGEVIAPLPSPLLIIGAAFFIKASFSWHLFYKVIFYVVLPLTLGSTIGATVIYFIAYFGGKPAIEKLNKYLRISWNDIERFEQRLSRRKFDVLILFISRMLPLVPTTIGNIVSGIIRMNPVYYIAVTFVGIFLRILLLLFIFYFFGQTIFLPLFNL